MATKMVLATFEDKEDAAQAINLLKGDGYNPKDISIIMKDKEGGQDMAKDTGANVAEGAVSGAASGVILGGLAGLAASFVIPGLGAFFIGGPIATALGLTGAAASTVSGAATGALAGGILGALTGMGLSRDEAKDYEDRIERGAILLAIPARIGEEDRVERILSDNNADNIKSVVAPEEQGATEPMIKRRRSHYDQPTYATAGAKGGKSKSSTSTSSKGKGWHGDPKEHAMAGRGESVKGKK
jgi:uncharacterized membrane protein